MTQNAFEKDIDIIKFLTLTGDIATVTAGTSYPPGARIAFTVFSVRLHGKVAGLQKFTDSSYRLTVKINSLSKKDRAVIVAAL